LIAIWSRFAMDGALIAALGFSVTDGVAGFRAGGAAAGAVNTGTEPSGRAVVLDEGTPRIGLGVSAAAFGRLKDGSVTRTPDLGDNVLAGLALPPISLERRLAGAVGSRPEEIGRTATNVVFAGGSLGNVGRTTARVEPARSRRSALAPGCFVSGASRTVAFGSSPRSTRATRSRPIPSLMTVLLFPTT
jgi:hypothetical protein